ncbi:MAG: pyridoxamine 5'-phosphate oxidase family protein [Dehalococcoidia bacterium]|nr:pyridoxamine 5'-phosphate oxidase family protein [Dehalococcoidia bacterium]
MIALTDEMKAAFETALADAAPVLVASAGKDGLPDIAFKGSAMIFDADHVAFWERALGTTFRNFQENPGACVLYRNAKTRTAWKMFGRATVLTEGEVRQQVMDRTIQFELDRDPERKGAAVMIRIDRVLQAGQVIMER